MGDRRHLIFLLTLFLGYFLFSKSVISGHLISTAFNSQESDQFIEQKIDIAPTAILDSEKLIEKAKTATQFADSIFSFIRVFPGEERIDIADSSVIGRHYKKGIDFLLNQADVTFPIPQQSPRLEAIQAQNIRQVILSLNQYALVLLLDAKKRDPYNPENEIHSTQRIVTRLMTLSLNDTELSEIYEKIKKTLWRSDEKHGFYLLSGMIYEQLKKWEFAYNFYRTAHEIATNGLYLPGLDSNFVHKMDSIASKVFIADERKLMAKVLEKQTFELKAIHDSLLTYYHFFADSGYVFIQADSQSTRQFIDQALNHLQPADQTENRQFRRISIRKYQLNLDDIMFLSRKLFIQIENQLLRAKELDPFNSLLRFKIARDFYFSLAQLYPDSSLLERSVTELENLIWVEKSNSGYYYWLGNAYIGLKNWQKAFENYQIAENTLIRATIIGAYGTPAYMAKPDSVPVSPEILYNYIFLQARAKIKLFEGKDALALLRRAQKTTLDPEKKRNIQVEIDAVNWDAGNIHAMNLRKKSYDLIAASDYKNAKTVCLELLDTLWTQRTKDEINSQIAIMDFNHLDRREDGIQRMYEVIAKMERDSAGSPLFAENQVYFEYYGRMCYELGLYYGLNKEERRLAYIYFVQSTQINWNGRSRAYLQLAELSKFSPAETVALCNKALLIPENLSPTDKRLTAELLSNAFQRQAKFKEAKEWHARSLDKNWCENREQI